MLGFVQPADALAALAGRRPEPLPDPEVRQAGEPGLQLLGRVGVVDPLSLHDYRAVGGYEALRRAIDLGPEKVIREVKDSRLMGRGGAAFPTGVKWEAVAQQPVRPHYLICNADESEPGTFKDRELMQKNPHMLIEGILIASWAAEIDRAFIYIRGEYAYQADILDAAIAEAYEAGYIGDRILGSEHSVSLVLHRGAGAYICGEETGLLDSLEGKRGNPRLKPPFPAIEGLYNGPTLINKIGRAHV